MRWVAARYRPKYLMMFNLRNFWLAASNFLNLCDGLAVKQDDTKIPIDKFVLIV